uniref:Uncharacterized protein n=1 Tax=Oryza brachyantha TaxID=4533 RepID=J3L1S5_ORYBR
PRPTLPRLRSGRRRRPARRAPASLPQRPPRAFGRRPRRRYAQARRFRAGVPNYGGLLVGRIAHGFYPQLSGNRSVTWSQSAKGTWDMICLCCDTLFT